jgi:hypothetical protein
MNWNFGNAVSNKSELVVVHSTPAAGETGYSYFLGVLVSFGALAVSHLWGNGRMTIRHALKNQRVSVFPLMPG